MFAPHPHQQVKGDLAPPCGVLPSAQSPRAPGPPSDHRGPMSGTQHIAGLLRTALLWVMLCFAVRPVDGHPRGGSGSQTPTDTYLRQGAGHMNPNTNLPIPGDGCPPGVGSTGSSSPPTSGDFYVFVKPTLRVSPTLVCTSNLLNSGIVTELYLGTHYFPIPADPQAAAELYQTMTEVVSGGLCQIRHYAHFRFEADGPKKLPQHEAIAVSSQNMLRALEVLADLPDSFLPTFENPEQHLQFFCTGSRSIYALARGASPEARTDWDVGARALIDAINRAAGEELLDPVPYGEHGWIVRLGYGDGEVEEQEETEAAVVPPDTPDTSTWPPINKARKTLEHTLQDALRTDGVHLIQAAPGTGKSTQAVTLAADCLIELSVQTGKDNIAALIASPTRDHRDTLVDRARSQTSVEIHAVSGRSPQTCMVHGLCTALAGRGYAPQATVCRQCQYAPWQHDITPTTCLYQACLVAAVDSANPRLLFCCYEQAPMLLEQLRRRHCHVPLLVLDEDPSRLFLHETVLKSASLEFDLPSAWHQQHFPGSDSAVLCNVGSRDARELRAVLCNTFDISAKLGPQPLPLLTTHHLCALMESANRGIDLDWLFRVGKQHSYRPSLNTALTEVAKWTRRHLAAAGDLTDALVERTMHADLPAIAEALAHDYRQYRAGRADWNSRITLMPDAQGEPSLHTLLSPRSPSYPATVLILDGTGNAARLRSAMPGHSPIQVTAIQARQLWTQTIWLRTSAGRKACRGKKGERILNYIQRIAAEYVPHEAQVLLVTYGNRADTDWQQACAEALRSGHNGEVEARHYAELRGLNRFEDFEVVITIGDNEPPPHELRRQVAAHHTDDPEPISLETEAQFGSWAYTDARSQAEHRAHTVDELGQVAHRCRPILHADRTYVHIGRRYPSQHVGRPGIIIHPRTWTAHAVARDVAAFVRRHGWFANSVAEAVGILVGDSGAAAPEHPYRAACADVVRKRYGAEFTSIDRPYRERRFRDILKPVVGDLPRIRVGDPVLLSLGIGEIWGRGDRERMRAALQQIGQELAAKEDKTCREKAG